jgi:V/A-type H+-transporting ATPase subunit F
MARLLVLTDPETALGFRLAGIETFSAREAKEAHGLILELLEKREEGVVIINEDFLPSFPEKVQKRIEESLQPVFVPVPHVESWREGEKKEEYLVRLLRRVMGYQIKIKR